MAFDRKQPTSKIVVSRGGVVYDVTEFADRHPGGRGLLEKHNGEDVENIMQDATFHAHSRAAYAILEKFRVNDSLITTAEDSEWGSDTGTESCDSPEVAPQWGDFDGYVDWSKPLMDQVERLGDEYFDWTHQPVAQPVRLFHSDLAEMFSKACWWMVPLVWGPVIIALTASSWTCLASRPEVWPASDALAHSHGPGSVPGLLAAGMFLWTLLEYVIHRWIFHLRPPGWSPFLIRLHFALHGQHHKSPMDPARLVFPPLPASAFAVVFYILCSLVFPTGMARAVCAGIIAGYVLYDLTHYYIHHGGTPPLAYFRQLKTYHTLHHYKHQQLGFGISSKLWDFPFQTLIPQAEEVTKLR